MTTVEPEPAPWGVRGGYVRHRDRMVAQSVFGDLRDALIACRWISGVTDRPVRQIETGVEGIVTTTDGQVLKLAGSSKIQLIDYFPEQTNPDAVGKNNSTPVNTFALDSGTPAPGVPLELGSLAEEVQYTFSMAFYAKSEALAKALLNDLRDRYVGRILRGPGIALYDFLSDDPMPVNVMAIDGFRYTQNTEIETPKGVELFFAELTLTDEVD